MQKAENQIRCTPSLVNYASDPVKCLKKERREERRVKKKVAGCLPRCGEI